MTDPGGHPMMFPVDHPLVQRVRAQCMRYPEAAEVLAHGRVTFRAGTRQFAIVGTVHDADPAVEFIPDPLSARHSSSATTSSSRRTRARTGGSRSASMRTRATGSCCTR